MRVFQIKTKSKSPKNNVNNKIKISTNKSKKSSNNDTKITRNIIVTKKQNNFRNIFKQNSFKRPYNLSPNDCSLINTTNFNNTKTNNFIFFESAMNYKDNEIFRQIKSLIKHNSSNNFLNTKFTNGNNINKVKSKKRKNSNSNKSKNKKDKKEKIDTKRNDSDKISINKTNKLSISTNYTLLLNNKNKEKEKVDKLKYINLSNLHPLTLNFSNDFNSYQKLITNKSTKYFNNYKLNFDIMKNNNRAKSTERKKVKSNSKNKLPKNKILINNKSFLKNSKSYNNIIYSYIKSLTKSTSFSPKRNKEENNLGKINIIKINHKKLSCMKVTDSDKINLQFFKNKKDDNKCLMKNIFSPLSSRMIDMKLYTKKFSKRESEKFFEKKNNNTFFKDNKRIIKNKKIRIATPEDNHFLAVINIQKIKKYGKTFS